MLKCCDKEMTNEGYSDSPYDCYIYVCPVCGRTEFVPVQYFDEE